MIEFKNVSKQFPAGFRAVENLNLTVRRGELCVLIGPSGCGKTTTMRMVNRLIAPSSGHILIEGVDNATLAEEDLRRKIGYAIQQIGLFPHMTVAENIAVVPKLLHWEEDRIRHRVDELLALVGLDPELYRNQYPRQLSGGQQQRVGVARALGADPPIMLMDEPFGAVDPITRATLQDEFLQIQSTVGKTIIFVTHDIDEAIRMGDRIAVMRDGKLVQYETPDNLLAAPVDRFVRDFVGADRQLKRLGLIPVSDVMNADPPRVFITDTLEAATEQFTRHNVKSVFVVDKRDHVLRGWLDREQMRTGRSLIDAMHEGNVHDIAVRETASVRDALSVMVTRSFRVTPVVDKQGRLKGSITLNALQEIIQSRAADATNGDGVELGTTAESRP